MGHYVPLLGFKNEKQMYYAASEGSFYFCEPVDGLRFYVHAAYPKGAYSVTAYTRNWDHRSAHADCLIQVVALIHHAITHGGNFYATE